MEPLKMAGRKPAADQIALDFAGDDGPRSVADDRPAEDAAKARYRQLRRDGLCHHCRGPAIPGKSLCQPCRDKSKAHKKAVYAERRDSGLCAFCAKPNDRDGQPCTACRGRISKNGAKHRKAKTDKRRAEGLCIQCGQPSPGRPLCDRCRIRVNRSTQAKRSERKLVGTCVACCTPVEPGVYRCPGCRESRRAYLSARLEERRAQGICANCKNKSITPSQSPHPLCMKHWLDRNSHSNNKRLKHPASRLDGAMLRRLWDEQGGKCAYTGIPLVPGLNASLDHKTPVSRDGTHEYANLQWVDVKINTMKRDFTHDEFLEICRVVAAGHARKEAETS